jgi:hypothetical protein
MLAIVKAKIEDSEKLFGLQVESFMATLEKYKDYETNPANEKIDRIIARINQTFTDYYLIRLDNEYIGGIRVINEGDQKRQ